MVADELLRNLSEAEGAGHVRVAAGLGVARVEVDHDRLALGDRAVPRFVPDGGLGAVGDDDDVRRDHALLAEYPGRLGAQVLAGDRSALAQTRADRVHRPLAGSLRPADPVQLSRGLDPATQVEQLALRLHLDLVGAQVVGQLERKVARRHRLLDPEAPAGAQDQLARELVVPEPLRDQLVEPELLQGHRLEPVDLPHAGNLERADERPPRAVSLRVDERVRHRHRHLVPELGRANGVPVDQDVGHPAGHATRLG